MLPRFAPSPSFGPTSADIIQQLLSRRPQGFAPPPPVGLRGISAPVLPEPIRPSKEALDRAMAEFLGKGVESVPGAGPTLSEETLAAIAAGRGNVPKHGIGWRWWQSATNPQKFSDWEWLQSANTPGSPTNLGILGMLEAKQAARQKEQENQRISREAQASREAMLTAADAGMMPWRNDQGRASGGGIPDVNMSSDRQQWQPVDPEEAWRRAMLWGAATPEQYNAFTQGQTRIGGEQRAWEMHPYEVAAKEAQALNLASEVDKNVAQLPGIRADAAKKLFDRQRAPILAMQNDLKFLTDQAEAQQKLKKGALDLSVWPEEQARKAPKGVPRDLEVAYWRGVAGVPMENFDLVRRQRNAFHDLASEVDFATLKQMADILPTLEGQAAKTGKMLFENSAGQWVKNEDQISEAKDFAASIGMNPWDVILAIPFKDRLLKAARSADIPMPLMLQMFNDDPQKTLDFFDIGPETQKRPELDSVLPPIKLPPERVRFGGGLFRR